MRRWRKGTRWLLALLLSTSVATSAAAAETAGPTSTTAQKKITIFHTNDVHSRVEGSNEGIGFAKMAAMIKNYKKADPNTLVLDDGDSFHGQTIANLVRGESIVNIMNAVGYDAMAAGNHDFNYGSDRLVELSKLTKFPVLSANTKKADGSTLLKPYVVQEVNGIKVGIFGLTTPETAYKTHPNNVAGITFADPAAEAKKIVAEMKGKVDVIIALAHLGVDKSSVDTSIKVAEQVPDIDVIIDGHSHTTLEKGMMVGNVLIAQTGEYLKAFGRVELTFENGKLTKKTAGLITKAMADADQTPADPAVLDIVNQVKKAQEPVLGQVVGTTSVDLVGDREVVRKGESNLGNLITDAMLDETKADVAITNGGGIRDSIKAGSITKGQVITVLPFGNYIETKKVKGSDIKAAMELGVSAYPDSLGGFPHVGGMTVEFDPAQPKGQRVTSIHVKGEPLDPQKTYLLATNDFMAAGGDNYTMFKDYPIANDFSSLEESVITYLQKKGQMAPQVEGRMIRKSAAAPAATEQPAASMENMYIVQPGDTLWHISMQYGTTWQKLQELNSLNNPNLIFPGQEIVVPAH